MAQLADVLKAIGPNAAIIFAAWIFMGFLQQRYDNAIDRYREVVGDYRSNDHDPERADNLKDQVLTYLHRCELMSHATLVGLIAAILLIASLILGAVDVLLPGSAAVGIAGIAASLGGFALVIVAAALVVTEGRIVHRQILDELRDVPDLRDEAKARGQRVRR